jgi:hypothetical protein
VAPALGERLLLLLFRGLSNLIIEVEGIPVDLVIVPCVVVCTM